MSLKDTALKDREKWLFAFSKLQELFMISALRLLGHTPDSPQVGWIQKSAAMCRFLFCLVQKSLAMDDHRDLTRDFEARWDRLVKPGATASLDTDLTLQEFESILVLRAYVCPLSGCGS
jgi:hypothetical protein